VSYRSSTPSMRRDTAASLHYPGNYPDSSPQCCQGTNACSEISTLSPLRGPCAAAHHYVLVLNHSHGLGSPSWLRSQTSLAASLAHPSECALPHRTPELPAIPLPHRRPQPKVALILLTNPVLLLVLQSIAVS
jgi:hypothetical protein